jgi:cell division protein FtsB
MNKKKLNMIRDGEIVYLKSRIRILNRYRNAEEQMVVVITKRIDELQEELDRLEADKKKLINTYSEVLTDENV